MIFSIYFTTVSVRSADFIPLFMTPYTKSQAMLAQVSGVQGFTSTNPYVVSA